MLKSKIINFVKYNKVILFLYRIFGNLLVKTLSLFVKQKNNKILFMSFGGRKYDDSPKALYEKIKDDIYFKDFELVWAFREPKNYKNIGCKVVKADTINFYIQALSSRIWINNSSVERGLQVRRKSTIEFNTWHGTPLKKMGSDINNNKGFGSKTSDKGIRYYCSQSSYDQEIFTRFFNIGKENILISDLPRNDMLTKYDQAEEIRVRKELGIPESKKVILYMPTFREFDKDSNYSCYINPPIDIKKWQKLLEDEYVLLFRAHYEVTKILGIQENSFIKNVSDHPCLNDLMIISNLLISDYSSVFFDYSILERPMLNFAYDYDAYCTYRGLYLDIEKDMGMKINLNEDSLLHEITQLDYDEYCKRTKLFKGKFAPNAGRACDIVIDKVKQVLDKEITQ